MKFATQISPLLNLYLFVDLFMNKSATKTFHTLSQIPIAERSKSSDHGRGDPCSDPGEGRFFSAFFQDGEQS